MSTELLENPYAMAVDNLYVQVGCNSMGGSGDHAGMKYIWRTLIPILTFLLFPVEYGVAGEVIVLTQTSCQFIEAEDGHDHHFDRHSSAQCEQINAQTAESRLDQAKVLRLSAGDYVFQVKNRDVDYDLGFWLRGSGLSRFTLPSVSGGGIAKGLQRAYRIRLEPGEYRYSCPLNPTPDYVLIVKPKNRH